MTHYIMYEIDNCLQKTHTRNNSGCGVDNLDSNPCIFNANTIDNAIVYQIYECCRRGNEKATVNVNAVSFYIIQRVGVKISCIAADGNTFSFGNPIGGVF